MQITWTEDGGYHTGSIDGRQWFSISHAPWNPGNPYWLNSSIPMPVTLSSGQCETVQVAKDRADEILAAFRALTAPEPE